MKKNLITLMMALFAITCSSVFVSCGNDGDDIPTPAPEQGKKGIHRIEATFSGDIENWNAVSYYVGHISENSFSELEYKTEGDILYELIFDEGISTKIPTAIMRDPIDVVVTTKQECERLGLAFGCFYKKMASNTSADKASTLTVNFKSYVDGKLTKTYSRTFTYKQVATVFFNSIEHSTDMEDVASDII